MLAAFDYIVHLALLIPILTIFMGILFGMWIAYLNYRKRRETYELHHKERLAAIEKGIEIPPIPPMLLRDEDLAVRHPTPRRDLLKGLMWLFLGIAIFIFLKAQNGDLSPSLGFIGVAIGLAYLIYHAVEGRRSGPTPPPQPPLA